jgi:hypothetical protein
MGISVTGVADSYAGKQIVCAMNYIARQYSLVNISSGLALTSIDRRVPHLPAASYLSRIVSLAAAPTLFDETLARRRGRAAVLNPCRRGSIAVPKPMKHRHRQRESLTRPIKPTRAKENPSRPAVVRAHATGMSNSSSSYRQPKSSTRTTTLNARTPAQCHRDGRDPASATANEPVDALRLRQLGAYPYTPDLGCPKCSTLTSPLPISSANASPRRRSTALNCCQHHGRAYHRKPRLAGMTSPAQ